MKPRNNRIFLSWVSIFILAACCLADVNKKLRINKESPEGQFLELVGMETDVARKVALLEQFLMLFPGSEPTAWVYGELQDRYARASKYDQAISVGEKLLALEPDNLEAARLNWRIAEAKGDPDAVKKWTVETSKIAERVVKQALPADAAEYNAAQQRAAYARQFVINTDYEDYMKALAIKNPAERLEAIAEFVRKSPQNPYAAQIEISEFLAYKELGDVNHAIAAAEKILARDETRSDAMLFIAEIAFRSHKDSKRVLELSAKAISLITSGEKPDGYSDELWKRAKTQNLSLAHYMAGNIYFNAEQWAAADRSYRAALSYIGDPQQRASVLNSLGWANYRMKNALDAIKFYRECAAIPGPLQEQAAKTVLAIKSEYNLQ